MTRQCDLPHERLPDPSSPKMLQNEVTVSTLMMDQTWMNRAQFMDMIERSLLTSVMDAAQAGGLMVDIPTLTWTCHIVARETGAYGGQSHHATQPLPD